MAIERYNAREAEARWQAVVRAKGIPAFVGTRFPKEIFDAVQETVLEYRGERGGGKAP
mgnify:CR=1 FL=1